MELKATLKTDTMKQKLVKVKYTQFIKEHDFGTAHSVYRKRFVVYSAKF